MRHAVHRAHQPRLQRAARRAVAGGGKVGCAELLGQRALDQVDFAEFALDPFRQQQVGDAGLVEALLQRAAVGGGQLQRAEAEQQQAQRGTEQ
ncbi:hypothetical protein D3C72_1876020 [compost metagenome]